MCSVSIKFDELCTLGALLRGARVPRGASGAPEQPAPPCLLQPHPTLGCSLILLPNYPRTGTASSPMVCLIPNQAPCCLPCQLLPCPRPRACCAPEAAAPREISSQLCCCYPHHGHARTCVWSPAEGLSLLCSPTYLMQKPHQVPPFGTRAPPASSSPPYNNTCCDTAT